MKYNDGIDVTIALKKMAECDNFDKLYQDYEENKD